MAAILRTLRRKNTTIKPMFKALAIADEIPAKAFPKANRNSTFAFALSYPVFRAPPLYFVALSAFMRNEVSFHFST
jgi:hypothetical protein